MPHTATQGANQGRNLAWLLLLQEESRSLLGPTPGAHLPDHRLDLAMAGFGVVTCYPSGGDLAYDRTGHFEPKAAYHTIASHFG